MHTLIVGSSNMNRTALVDRLLDALDPNLKLYGYRTIKEPPGEDGRCPIYIYPVDGPCAQRADNLLGWCRNQEAEAYPETFDRHAFYIESARPDGLLVMDEIGPMESLSIYFRNAVIAALNGDVPILATVRDKDTPFLNKVRGTENAKIFLLTKQNQKSIFDEIIIFLKGQIVK